MPVEQATYINNLDKSWPLSQDGVNEGDNHLRLLKKVLQAQFPGSGGAGFSKKITATEDEINRLGGVTSPIQEQIDAIINWQSGAEDTLYAPQNTHMLFGQNGVPSGWTVAHYGATQSLVVVDPDNGGNPGFSGGTDDPNQYLASHTHHLREAISIFAQEWSSGNKVHLLGTDTSDAGGVDWNPRYLESVVGVKD